MTIIIEEDSSGWFSLKAVDEGKEIEDYAWNHRPSIGDVLLRIFNLLATEEDEQNASRLYLEKIFETKIQV